MLLGYSFKPRPIANNNYSIICSFSFIVLEPHCYNVTKTVENVYQEANKPLSLVIMWDSSLIGGTVGVIFGIVSDRAGKCIVERAMTIMLATNTKHCPQFTGYKSWCENETSFSVKKNSNGSLEVIVKFSVQSMLRYLGNVTVNNTILFSSRLQYSYLSTNESATDRTIQVLILGGYAKIYTWIKVNDVFIIIIMLADELWIK